MKPDEAVAAIMDAVLRNKSLVLLPRMTYFAYFLKGWVFEFNKNLLRKCGTKCQ